jgi:hypothetical protein
MVPVEEILVSSAVLSGMPVAPRTASAADPASSAEKDGTFLSTIYCFGHN